MEANVNAAGAQGVQGFEPKWLVYVGDPKLINGGDNFIRYGLITETNWGPIGSDRTRATREPRPRFWLVEEAADDANAVIGEPTQKWREANRFRILRFHISGHYLDGRETLWYTDNFIIETPIPIFGEWNETLEPDGFVEGIDSVILRTETDE